MNAVVCELLLCAGDLANLVSGLRR